jgi:hypothetical protein
MAKYITFSPEQTYKVMTVWYSPIGRTFGLCRSPCGKCLEPTEVADVKGSDIGEDWCIYLVHDNIAIKMEYGHEYKPPSGNPILRISGWQYTPCMEYANDVFDVQLHTLLRTMDRQESLLYCDALRLPRMPVSSGQYAGCRGGGMDSYERKYVQEVRTMLLVPEAAPSDAKRALDSPEAEQSDAKRARVDAGGEAPV